MIRFSRLAALAVVILLASALPALAQAGQSASATFTVSVTVVRSCVVETPASLAPGAPSPARDVRLACGRAPSTTPLSSSGILPVSGVVVPASVSSSKNEHGLVVSVNF